LFYQQKQYVICTYKSSDLHCVLTKTSPTFCIRNIRTALRTVQLRGSAIENCVWVWQGLYVVKLILGILLYIVVTGGA